jgi:ABC-type transport system involved in multi-copper enzyme maturation permease subunit
MTTGIRMTVISQKNIITVVFTILIFCVISCNYALLSVTALANNNNNNSPKRVDKFGIKEIYPTKPGGREWFLDADDPRSDGLFYITSNKNITK